MVDISKFAKEHQEIYPRLEALLLKLTKVKNTPDNDYLLSTTTGVLTYIKSILEGHFNEEELELFELLKPEDKEVLVFDHKDIRAKFASVEATLEELNVWRQQVSATEFESADLKQKLLFPAYNLIATVTHHAQREDSKIDILMSILRSQS